MSYTQAVLALNFFTNQTPEFSKPASVPHPPVKEKPPKICAKKERSRPMQQPLKFGKR